MQASRKNEDKTQILKKNSYSNFIKFIDQRVFLAGDIQIIVKSVIGNFFEEQKTLTSLIFIIDFETGKCDENSKLRKFKRNYFVSCFNFTSLSRWVCFLRL